MFYLAALCQTLRKVTAFSSFAQISSYFSQPTASKSKSPTPIHNSQLSQHYSYAQQPSPKSLMFIIFNLQLTPIHFLFTCRP